MKYLLAFFILMVFSCVAAAESKITVGEALAISQALNQLNCQNRVIKDGAKETFVCEPYKHSAGLTWLISGNMRKLKPIIEQYSDVRNKAVAALPRKENGDPTDAALAKFALDDASWQAAPADVQLDHFTRVTIEAIPGLMPGTVSALMPIIDP